MNCSVFRARHPSLICECNLRWWAVEGERLHTAVITGLATAAHFIKQGRRWSTMAVSGIIVWEGVRRKVAGPEQAVSAKARRYARGVKEQRGVIYQGRLHPWWEISRLAWKNRMGLVAWTTWNTLAFRKRPFYNFKVSHTLQGSDTEMWLIYAALKKKDELFMNYLTSPQGCVLRNMLILTDLSISLTWCIVIIKNGQCKPISAKQVGIKKLHNKSLV